MKLVKNKCNKKCDNEKSIESGATKTTKEKENKPIKL